VQTLQEQIKVKSKHQTYTNTHTHTQMQDDICSVWASTCYASGQCFRRSPVPSAAGYVCRDSQIGRTGAFKPCPSSW